MTFNVNAIIPILIGAVAVVIAIISFSDGRKRTRLLETMIKTLPYTSRPKKSSTSVKKRTSTKQNTNSPQSEELKKMKLELEREKHQWQKNKDIAKGIAWVLDHLEIADGYEDD